MSNHSLILASDRQVLFACNAGDGTVSCLQVGADFTVTPLRTTAVGLTPTSLAYRDGRLFVALSGRTMDDEPTSLAGFQIGDDGGLTPIEGSTAVISDAEMTKPTDLHVTADGTGLLVLDTMTSMITFFPVAEDGALGEAVVTPSSGMGPFGAAILGNGVIVVTETQGGPMNGPTLATLSSYTIGADGVLTPISDQIPNMRTASCWVSLTPDGTQAISANTGDGTVSTYAVANDGSLTLAQSVAAQQATTLANSSAPIDSAISEDGAYYYQLRGGLGVITGYQIGSDGSLAPIDGANGPGLPQLGAQGIVAI